MEFQKDLQTDSYNEEKHLKSEKCKRD